MRALLLIVTVLLVLPAAAHAGGTASVQGDTLVITGTPGVDMIATEIYPDGSISAEQIGLDPSLGPQTAGPGCERKSFYRGDAEKIFCNAAGVTRIAVDLGAGDDRFVKLTRVTQTATVDMGQGDDWADDYGKGGGVFRLGDGDDRGGAGGGSTASFEGGDGNDSLMCEDRDPDQSRGVRVLDGGAGRDELCGGRVGDTLEGGAGDDEIKGADGADRIDGGSGDDELEGEDGADRITGGRGEDEIDGGSGSDDIRARDREADDVSCGSKRDKVVADRSDDLTRCENVSLR